MTVLHVDYLRFLLPENFDGSLGDALRLAADHFDNRGYNDILAPKSFPNITQEQANEVWDCFNEVVNNEGHICGVFALNKWDRDSKDWKNVLCEEQKVGK